MLESLGGAPGLLRVAVIMAGSCAGSQAMSVCTGIPPPRPSPSPAGSSSIPPFLPHRAPVLLDASTLLAVLASVITPDINVIVTERSGEPVTS